MTRISNIAWKWTRVSAWMVAALVLALEPGFALGSTTEEVIPVGEVFVPSGFDSGSEAFVVVSGYFPNTCYRWSRAEVQKTGELQLEIRSYAEVRPGPCLMMMVPYSQEVTLGKLQSGAHDLHFMTGDGTYIERDLIIE